MKYVKPFITCNENAKEMISFYKDVFSADLLSIEEFKDVPMANDGDVLNARLLIKDLELNFMDMKKEYFVGYTHSFSFLIECDSKDEFYKYFDQLKVDGNVMMGPEPVMMWELTTWVTDKYGVTWQLIV